MAKHGELTDFDAIITDAEISLELYEKLKKNGCNVIKSASYLGRK